MTDRNASIHFGITGADASRQDLKGIRDELEKAGPAGVQSAQRITDGFTNVEHAAERVSTKISEGRAVTVRDGNAMIQSFEALKQEINSAFGSIANAPTAVQQGFAKAEAQFHATTGAVKTMTTATKENQQAVLGNTAQWGGWEQQLLKMSGADGALGKAVIGIGGATAAFTAGWAEGQKLNKLFGTDMSVWEEKSDVWGKKLGVLVRDLSDEIIAAANAVYDVMTGHFGDAKRDIAELKADVARHMQDLGHVINDSAEDWNKYAISTNRATLSTKGAQEGTAKLREEHNKLAHEIKGVTDELKNLDKELDKQKTALMDSEHGVVNATGDLGRYASQMDTAAAAVADQKAKVIDLSEKYGESSLVTVAAKEKQTQLEAALASATRAHDAAKQEVSRYEAAQQTAQTAVHDLTIKHNEQEIAVKELKKEYEKQATALGDHIEKAHAIAAAHGAIALNVANGKIAIVSIKKPVEDLTTAFHLHNEELATTVQQLTTILQQLHDLPGAAGPAATALHTLGDAAAGAAGDGLPSYQTPGGPTPMTSLH